MKEDLLKQLLESILGRSKSARGGDEAVFKCPSCNHHKNKLTFNANLSFNTLPQHIFFTSPLSLNSTRQSINTFLAFKLFNI